MKAPDSDSEDLAQLLKAVRGVFPKETETEEERSKAAVKLFWCWLLEGIPEPAGGEKRPFYGPWPLWAFGPLDQNKGAWRWQAFEMELGAERVSSLEALEKLSVTRFARGLKAAGLTKNQRYHVYEKLHLSSEKVEAAVEGKGGSFDGWLEQLGLDIETKEVKDFKQAVFETERTRDSGRAFDCLNEAIEVTNKFIKEEDDTILRAYGHVKEKLGTVRRQLELERRLSEAQNCLASQKDSNTTLKDCMKAAMESGLWLSSCAVSKTPQYGHGKLSHKLYIVHRGSVDAYSTAGSNRGLSSKVYTVDCGGHFGEMQLLHRSELHGFMRASKDDTLVWVVDKDCFDEYRGVTMQLLRTVAERLRFCQERASNPSAPISNTGEPCYLRAQLKEKTQNGSKEGERTVQYFEPLVDPKDGAKLSEIPIYMCAEQPFGCEELRVFLDAGVRFRALVTSSTSADGSGTDGAEMTAEYMRADKLCDLGLLSLSSSTDRGLCKLVATLLKRRIIMPDGRPAFDLLRIHCGEEETDEWSDARKKLVESLNHAAGDCGDKTLQLAGLMDYPIDLACRFAKYATRLAEEKPNERYDACIPEFEQIACSMLQETNSASEVEIILRQSVAQRSVLQQSVLPDCRDLFEFVIADPPLAEVASCPQFSDYVDAFWQRHQVTAARGLDEDAKTSKWREEAEEMAKTTCDLTNCTWSQMLTAPVKWALLQISSH
eukprot:COSAG03_NODE_328_length_8950_cov_24.961021_2_plen_716_part_00